VRALKSYGLAPALLAALYVVAAQAAQEDYDIDADHTFATFEIRHLGISTQRGRFGNARGKVTLDSEASAGSTDIVLDARSVSTGSEAMQKLLRGKDFFNVDEFPEIRYRGESINYSDGKPDSIDGQLTLLGITRPVRLVVTGFDCTRKPFLVQLRCGLDATAAIRRSDFGMTSLISFTSDEVKLAIQSEAVLQSQPQKLE
jgi:polyisoprenoid-binding protein YceI